ncbi:MAG: NifU family protein, partial [Hyphomicrobiales bacterium]
MFIQTEATPNPATLKFIPGKVVLADGTRDYRDADQTDDSPLAQRLFMIQGVSGVFFGSDFISITKDDTDWQHLKPAVLGAIMEHYMSGAPVVGDAGMEEQGAEDFDEVDVDIVDTIKELLDTRVRPAVAQDGGDITFYGYRDGIVHLRMQGACAGCP